MEEYLRLSHMETIQKNELDVSCRNSYYLPHHLITKADSRTTKLRVIFDALAKWSSERSLNNNLLVGPTIQSTLQHTLLRFRFHKTVMTADIKKMFRQILVDKQHTNYQRILWRKGRHKPIQEFRLLIVTNRVLHSLQPEFYVNLLKIAKLTFQKHQKLSIEIPMLTT